MLKRIQQNLLAYLYSLTNSRYRAIQRSGIFDGDYYLSANPDVAAAGSHPLVHYFREGWREGRSPHILFDIHYYLNQAPEIKDDEIEPIQHFIDGGWMQGRKPNPFFDPLYYAEKQSEVEYSTINPLSHFIAQGQPKNLYIHPYLDLQFYLDRYRDVAESGLDPLIHYITIGRKECRQPGLFFDVSWYLDRTPVLREAAEDILDHYLLFGAAEGKSPSPVFDPAYYRATYQDLIGNTTDLLGHYIKKGSKLELRPCAWFDPVFYKHKYLISSPSLALGHYLSEGVFLGNYPNSEIQALPQKPLISLIVPVYNVAAHHLNNCIRSVLYQSYPHWQLCLADDCSTSSHVRPLLEEWAARDSRIQITFLDRNTGISGASNAAASLASGDYYGFLDNDDELSPECLAKIAQSICESGADLLYTDEDLIGEDGRCFSVFYKPDFNPELLLCHNYVTHFVVTTAGLFQKVGGMAADKAGAQDYDLFLKLSEQARNVVHIPETLYHWRASETSTSINHAQKEYADEAGRQSVAAALLRRDIDGEVLSTELKYFYRPKRELYLLPLVSIVIYWDQQHDDPTAWLQQLISITAYKNYEIIFLGDEGAIPESLRNLALASDQPIRLIVTGGSQGIAANYNAALGHCDGEYVAFVSSDISMESETWLSTLLEYCQGPSTGAVCGRLDSDTAAVDNLRPLPDVNNQSPWYYCRYLQQASILLNGLQCPQNIWSLTGECCVVKKESLDRCGGFAAGEFPELFAFPDLSFKLLEMGLQLYYTPHCRATWRCAARRFSHWSSESTMVAEREAFQNKWRQTLLQGDPFFNRGKLQEADIPAADFLSWSAGISAA